MKRFEYEVREFEHNQSSSNKVNRMLFENWLHSYGSDGWELILIQPLQSFSPSGIETPGKLNMRLAFLCVFKRRYSLLRRYLYKLHYKHEVL